MWREPSEARVGSRAGPGVAVSRLASALGETGELAAGESRNLLHVIAHPSLIAFRRPALSGLYSTRLRHAFESLTWRGTGYSPLALVAASTVMLEPLAATVLTSILPSRPLSNKFSANKSAFGMAGRTASHSLSADFYTTSEKGRRKWEGQRQGYARGRIRCLCPRSRWQTAKALLRRCE